MWYTCDAVHAFQPYVRWGNFSDDGLQNYRRIHVGHYADVCK